MSKISITNKTDLEIRGALALWYSRSTKEIEEAGKAWYADAQQFANKLEEEFDLDPYVAAGVISALSPNNKWERNKVDARMVCVAWSKGLQADSVKVCTYNANKEKAFRILEGEMITEKSPKTHAFAMNIGLNSPDHITIDKWHLRACCLAPNDGIQSCVESCTALQYRRVEAITSSLAHDLGLKGYEFQAVVWLTIKETWGR
jgi:hypothetical protein